MRHVAGVVVGLLGTVIGLALVGLGFGQAAYAVSVILSEAGRVTGALLVLLGGLVLGGVVVARRLSPAAPLTGGALLLLLSLIDLAFPRWWYALGLGGQSYSLGGAVGLLIQYQISIGLAGILMAAAFAGSRRAAPVPAPPVHPPWGYVPPR